MSTSLPTIRYGPLHLEEWAGRWKMRENDGWSIEGDLEAFDNTCQAIIEQVTGVRDGIPPHGWWYLRGDNYADDRTSYLEFYDYRLLTARFIQAMQLFLTNYEQGTWRLLIPLYAVDDCMVIYASTICWPPCFGRISDEQALVHPMFHSPPASRDRRSNAEQDA